MRQFEAFRVQHQAPDLQLAHRPIELSVTIFIISGDFMSFGLAMNADLMCTPGDKFHSYDAELATSLQHLHPAMCRLPGIIDPHAPFTVWHVDLFQWQLDVDQILRPVAFHDGAIVFTHRFILQHGLQCQQ